MSTTSLLPITVYGAGGPNPPKVAIILKELNVPHKIIPTTIPEVKLPPYLKINPNGRLPAIQDPNTSITLWESGAIVEYLVERYDTEKKLSWEMGSKESWEAKQWLYFQASGQGPYYGQAGWFAMYHPEKVQSAIDRYMGEINRITGVLEGHLKKRKEEGMDEPWMVGNMCSYVDLSFVVWQTMIGRFTTKEQYDQENFPEVSSWMARMLARASVKEVLDAVASHMMVVKK
jgi:glutathione S-transferase